jgi:hypothetical protein
MIRRSALLLAVLLLPACDEHGDTPKRDQPASAPIGTSASPLATTVVRVTWIDTSSWEAGFEVQFRPVGGGAFTAGPSVGADVVSADVGGLAANTAYEFQVVAFNSLGPSAPSNTAMATTRTALWVRLVDAPVATQAAQSVHDTLRNRMVVFGGQDDGGLPSDDLWALNLSPAPPTFSPISVPGLRPGPRIKPSLIYDSGRDKLVLFGGLSINDGQPVNDLWEFDLVSLMWTPLSTPANPPAPLARLGHSAIYDPVNARMIVFGGFDGVLPLNDVARLNLSAGGSVAWEALTVLGTPPAERDTHTAVYDTWDQRMIVFAGNDNGAQGGAFANDLWALSLSSGSVLSWTPLSPAGTLPPPREGQAAVYDSINRQMVVFGGKEEATNLPEDRVWTLSLGGALLWTEISPLSPSPNPRAYVTAIYDPGIPRMIICGGERPSFPTDIELWALGL